MSSQNGHLDVVQHILASGREIDTKMKSNWNNKTAAEQARAMSDELKQRYETVADPPRRKRNLPNHR